MDFQHSEDRQMLADSLGRYLQQQYPIDVRNGISASDAGWSRDKWNELAELGVIGALFDERVGGYGGTGFDIAVVFEQLGRALVVEPFLSTLMAGRLLAAMGETALVEQVIAGERVVAFAHSEAHNPYDLADIATTASPSGDRWLLKGGKAVVPQLASADELIVSAHAQRDGEADAAVSLFRLDGGSAQARVQDYPMVDGGRGGDLWLDQTPASLVGGQGEAYPAIEEAVAAGIVALCWEAVGVMDVIRDATLDYLRTRKQFGVAIGKFQALQHRMATVALEIEQARSAAINAADALGGDRDRRERAVSAAKYTIGRVGTLVAEEAIQMHGGIGMTEELPLSHYAKRLTMIGHQLGDEDHHLARYSAIGRAA
ncbi:acyl-CoA dehydrogenase family protein [Sphingobium estronivorans]|uniref:acyl-CoA dehydrogenase family protein n=1 Tax=Sphingobium estronivorans TaxID=1577690 RepID=UPI001238BF9F|nr:acyl-CoA dehydrogenase family protein [Sphingobium estronivorans]